ncbi:coiled-coil and C2 domain-containing protein 1A [Protopterus annectens]|uniref:coiled-coil and C2 domain-containing protein 1A n=1 Tax=Protopterus annectens TaxID=7888 RepID=UPI001CFA541C|nr:coiled-coil and C2 domain-containing protein 1A [Protopterus annectens]
MNKNKRAPGPKVKGQGAATARQLGLLVDFSPDGGLIGIGDEDEDDGALEAELLALTGENSGGRGRPKGKAPLPMEHIERMAALCMKDLDDENLDDEDVENDAELLAELNDVLEYDKTEDSLHPPKLPPAQGRLSPTRTPQLSAAPSPADGLESTLAERLESYKIAISNAKQAGESAKVRRYERGLKTLETMLTCVKKGRKINEEEIPPAVATGKNTGISEDMSSTVSPLLLKGEKLVPMEQQTSTSNNAHTDHPPVVAPRPVPPPVLFPKPVITSVGSNTPSPVTPPERTVAGRTTAHLDHPSQVAPHSAPPSELHPKPRPSSLCTGTPSSLAQPVAQLTRLSPSNLQQATGPRAATSSSPSGSVNSGTKETVLNRQREYKVAAVQAKQNGDIELAKSYYRTAKNLDSMVEAVERGESLDLRDLPPAPGMLPKEPSRQLPQPMMSPAAVSPVTTGTPVTPCTPTPPRDLMEALQQRMLKYQSAATEAKNTGNDRKARMHERIVKQYQDAIRAHKAGKPVQLLELPVPPGFPPLQGTEDSGGDQSIMGVLETAMKLANQEDDGDEDEEERKVAAHPVPQRAAPAMQVKSAAPQTARTAASNTAAAPAKQVPKSNTRAQQQLDFLENRKKQFQQAALRAKQKNDIEGAKMYLIQSRGLDPMIEAAKNGLPVDITKVPPAPVYEEDFQLQNSRGARISPKTAEQYNELMGVLKQQHEKCLSYSQQFTHLGNVAETTKFEKMAEDCKKSIEVLKIAHAKSYPLPKYHYEERTFNTVKIFPNLSSNDMVLHIVKGINFPPPPGGSPNDLDACVRFEFAFPNTEEAQRDKTSSFKGRNSPEFNEKFKLSINRGHRGFKRVIQTKGIKFELIQKGNLFKSERVIGTAQLKLDALETKCEIRDIIEILDGRKPTGGRLEVTVRIREPLTSQQLETVTEKWLIVDPFSMPPVAVPKPKDRGSDMKDVGPSHAPAVLQSLEVLRFDKSRIEKRIQAFREAQREVPVDLMNQYQEISQQIQLEKTQLERGDPAFMKEYFVQLQRFLQHYTESAKRMGAEGRRDAAKDVLHKRKLVDEELKRFRR